MSFVNCHVGSIVSFDTLEKSNVLGVIICVEEINGEIIVDVLTEDNTVNILNPCNLSVFDTDIGECLQGWEKDFNYDFKSFDAIHSGIGEMVAFDTEIKNAKEDRYYVTINSLLGVIVKVNKDNGFVDILGQDNNIYTIRDGTYGSFGQKFVKSLNHWIAVGGGPRFVKQIRKLNFKLIVS